ncbi:serine hydrolase domain-containing protein [Hyphococcus sp.]|uniref:serine hydrolase domain-containing protein n=1 Tax=Hyphococcus sp. TaxID=2038636 RepID=UPI0035C67745
MRNFTKHALQAIAIGSLFTLGACAPENTGRVVSVEAPQNAIDKDHLKRIDAVLQKEVDEGVRAGFVAAVVTRDGVAYQTAVGEADPFNDTPMTLDTRFRFASMTKPIISVAVMQLVDRGIINLNDPAGLYIDSYNDARVATSRDLNSDGEFETRPASRPITVHDLLTHMAGIGYGFTQNTDLEKAYFDANLFNTDGTLCERIDQIAAVPLLQDPGTKWDYSYSIDVLGCLIEVATGTPLDQYLSENIFEPLGMTETEFFMDEADLEDLALVIEFDENGEMVRSGGTDLAQGINDVPFGVMSGGAGLLSNVHDYTRFMRMLLNYGTLDGTRILSPQTVRLMTSDHTPEETRPPYWLASGTSFGLGGSVVLEPGYTGEVAAAGDWGWAGYWDTWFSINTELGVGYITLSQAQPNPYIKPSRARFGVKAIAYSALED